MEKATFRRQQPAVVPLDRRDRPDCSRYLIAIHRDQVTVVADSVAVDAAGQDVHPNQLVAAGVPTGALRPAPSGRLCRRPPRPSRRILQKGGVVAHLKIRHRHGRKPGPGERIAIDCNNEPGRPPPTA